ncbi:unnamed protein product [Ectocarpus sp. CCAP 1310/34]|nr:unnamed protein product [Ectocarpus sp. CCAP 1310/34]
MKSQIASWTQGLLNKHSEDKVYFDRPEWHP